MLLLFLPTFLIKLRCRLSNKISKVEERSKKMMKRFYVIAPNGDKCSVIWANIQKTIVQTWSGKRKQWESFPIKYCIICK